MSATSPLGFPRRPANPVISGAGVKSERSESRGDAVGALDARPGDHTLTWSGQAGYATQEEAVRTHGSRVGEPRLLLRIEEAAERLGIGRSLMYRLVMSGAVESVPLGRLRRIPSECLQEFVDRLREESRPAGGDEGG